jgi:hypothetical protein
VGLGGGVPAAVSEGGDRLPVGVGGLAGTDPLEGGGRDREPGLAAAQLGDLLAVEVGDLQADRPRAGVDQGEAADPVGMAGDIQEGEGRAGRMGQQVDPVQAEPGAEGFDVADLPVAPEGRRVRRDRRRPGPAQVQQDQ